MNWFVGQLVFTVMAIASFMTVTVVGGILVSGGRASFSWSNTITKYESRYPDEAGNFVSSLIPSNLYNQMSLPIAVLQTLVLMFLYMFLLSQIIYFFKMIHIQSLGLFVSVFVVAAGVMTCSLRVPAMWAFPMANAIAWLHYNEILSARVYPVWGSYCYFIVLITIMVTINVIAAKKLQLYNIELVE